MTAKITEFNRATCKTINEEIEKALAELGTRLGLKFSQGGGSIGFTDFTAKVRVTIDDPAAKDDLERGIWNQYCGSFGLRPEDFGTVVTSKGERYRVDGLALNRSTRPIKITRLRDQSPRIAPTEWVPMIRKATDERLAA